MSAALSKEEQRPMVVRTLKIVQGILAELDPILNK